LAVNIANKYEEWHQQRRPWIDEKKELRNYIFATDTTKTTNSQLPWKNKTTIPKLCQIRDNLHANYLAALFPNDRWLRWEGYAAEDQIEEKRKAVETYMANKTREGNFRTVISQLVYDYIDYGNCFAEVVWTDSSKTLGTGELVDTYIGPEARRISPFDILFNPIADTFDKSPKITRYIKTIGELEAELRVHPEQQDYIQEALDQIKSVRHSVSQYKETDVDKAAGFLVDGFGSLSEYYQSNYVEILKFEGDIYDEDTNQLLVDHIIYILDKSVVLLKKPNPSWLGKSSKVHVGWRLRPDNLYAMGPLDNLVGMQYRIDHLENLKADVFDFIAHPMVGIRGDVEEYEYGPGKEVFLGDDGDITFLKPDATALNADLQIDILENKMEEMAGAPRQAMGIRTPGEKTAFEVQQLQNAAGRIFQSKVTNFEVNFLEPILNRMFELAKREMEVPDVIRVMDDDIGVVEFMSVTKADITAKGKLRPIGARHFAAKAQMTQNLVGIFSSPLAGIIQPHVSGIQLAKLVEDMLDLERFGLIKENAFIEEQAKTQKLMNAFAEDLQVEQEISVEDEGEEILS